MPKVSVIIPVYNIEEYLRECLDSVINQTLTDLEIICVNDGSTDNSLEILNEYAAKDSRIKIINKENAGLGAARNSGMKIATGECIGFIDSDDFVTTDCFEELYNKLTTDNADICILGYQVYNTISKKTYQVTTEVYNERVTPVCSYKEIKSSIFTRFPAWNKFYKKEFLDNNNLFFPEAVFFEDVVFNTKSLLLAERITFLDKEPYIYRSNRTNSIMDVAKNDLRVLDVFKFLNEVDDFIKTIDALEELEYEYYYFVLEQIKFHKQRIASKKVLKTFNKTYKKYFKKIDLYNVIKRHPDLNNYHNKYIKPKNKSKIFAIENEGTRKKITILGIKFKIKSKELEQKQKEQKLEKKINKLIHQMDNLNKKLSDIGEKLDA